MSFDLPASVTHVDISDWDGVTPENLLLDPSRVSAHPTQTAGARALRYARAEASASYDEIGFRMLAAAPQRGPVALQTIASMRLERTKQEATGSDSLLDEIRSEVRLIVHRPLDIPEDGRFRYEIVADGLIDLTRISEPDRKVSEESWTFSLSDPPKMFFQMTLDRDAPHIMTQGYRVNLPGSFWLPLDALIRNGRFLRLQDCRQQLTQLTSSGAFYCFVSHRWLSPTHPDPAARQAQLVAWQLFAYLCEAIRVAHARGLEIPRKFSQLLGTPVGISGSELSEALIVNVLRPRLDQRSLARAASEVESVGEILDDYGVATALNDSDVRLLEELLRRRPTIQALLERIYVWYDYSCLAQHPRSDDDERLFRQGLNELVPAQIVGRTVVLLDDAEDYLSRAWCTLESLVSDSAGGALDLLVGSARPTSFKGTVEQPRRRAEPP